jgi:transposase
MSDLYWLTEEQMARLQTYFLKSHGKPRVDDRRVLSGIVFVTATGYAGVVRRMTMGPTSLS